MVFVIHFYNRQFVYKFLHANKFRYIHFANNKKLLYGHTNNRWFSLSVPVKNSKESQKLPKAPNPIFEKFEKMLNSLSVQQGNDFEFPTNFGSIRFDSDVNFTSLDKNELSAAYNSESNIENTDNFIEDTFLNNLESQNSNKVNEDVLNISHKELKDQDLNYVDDQYLKVSSIGETNTSDNYNSEMIPDSSSLNFIDSQIVGLSNKAVKGTESDVGDNEDYIKDKMSCFYNFEDSIDETIEENFVKKVIKNADNINDENWRATMENKLLSMTEEGSKYLRELNQSQVHNKNHKFENKDKTVEQKMASLDSDEQESKSEPDELMNEQQGNVKSAYSFVMEKRREEMISSKKEIKGEILETERYKKIILEIPSFSLHSTYDLAKVLRANILYQNDDFLAISKPYGIPIHGGGSKANDRLNIINSLPILAELIKVKKVEAVHRLDMNVTGVMLLAKTEQMADDLKKMFKQHKIKKTYCAIVKGVPEHLNGVIDIPIGEGKVGKFERMVLRPDISGFRGKSNQFKKAITRYKVVSSVPGAALLNINPVTGVKHQIRVHLGFGINCPVIGDHKYSYLTKIVPQKLPGPVLQRLGMQQSKVRTLPLLLHSLSVTLPIIGPNGTEIVIGAIPPKFFRTALKALKLSSMRSRLTNEYSDLIFGNRTDVKTESGLYQ
ncbi:UNVERIFIED_CONTAM: hypothetical protein RMT77_003641 [Armadillidium vulgare]